MMRTIRTVVGVVAGLVFGAASTADAQATAPTFAKDIAPIVFDKCAGCHRAGEVAPMSLLTYDEVRPWARAIKAKVTTREMPPWHADRRYGTFLNDPSLTDDQIRTIARWVDAGAPRGNDADMPPTPTFATGWRGGTPDYVFEMPVEYAVPAEGQVDVLHFWVPVPFAEDRFVQKLELRPGNSEVVHHARVDVANVPEGLKVVNGVLTGPDGRPANGLDSGGSRRDSFEDNNYHLISFVPGRGLEQHREGTAKRLRAGQWVRFEVHYNPTGEPATDRTKLGVWFAKGPVTHEVYTRSVGQPLPTVDGPSTFIVEGKELAPIVRPDGTRTRGKIPNIPPFVENWEIIGVTAVTEPIVLYALSPHMHLRGKDLKWIVTWPDGREETLLDVPKYDFNWQLNYELKTPLRLPAGSKLTAIGHFDNSSKNRYNPAPHKEVYWSDQSWDEMFIPYIEYTLPGRPLQTGSQTRTQQQQP